jgi:hypothetical protein
LFSLAPSDLLPDPGIEKFASLALEHNKDVRVVVQPIWLRWDSAECQIGTSHLVWGKILLR